MSITNVNFHILRLISELRIDINNVSPDVLKRIDYLAKCELVKYHDGGVHITNSGLRLLADPVKYSPTYPDMPHEETHRAEEREEEKQMRREESNSHLERENLINEAVFRMLGALFRLVIVYLLGVYTPMDVKIKITVFLAGILNPILEAIESLH